MCIYTSERAQGELLIEFERGLGQSDAARCAPNGGIYRPFWCADRGQWCIERRIGRWRETIVGFDSEAFTSRDRAVAWAIADGRAKFKTGVPLCGREQLI